MTRVSELVSELVIAGGPTHLDTFNLAEGSDAMVIAGVSTIRANGDTWEYEQQPDTLCPVRWYGHRLHRSVRVIVYPGATLRQIAEACEESLIRGLGIV